MHAGGLFLFLTEKRRINRIEIDPYTLEIYQLNNEEKLPYSNLSLSTFLIDQVYVHQYEQVDLFNNFYWIIIYVVYYNLIHP